MNKFPIFAAAMATLLLTAPGAYAQQGGRFERVQGDVRVVRGGQTLNARPGLDVLPRDRIVTGVNGAAGFSTPDNGMFALGPNSQMVIEEIAFNRQTQDGNLAVRFLKGSFSVISGVLGKIAPQKTRIQTPNATIGIRGTEFSVRVDVPPELEGEVLADPVPAK